MYDDEKNDPKRLLNNEKKKEIAETTSMQVSDVQDVLQKYYQLQNFHLYLKGKKQRNEPMPESRDELMQMYRVEKPSFLIPKQHKKSYTKAQLKFTMRRHHT
jgi:signal recognition particle GTPase